MISKWVVVAMMCVVPAFAAPIFISNTGVGAAGEGLVDPNWQIFTGEALVTTGSPGSFPFAFDGSALWLANDGTSQWISPQATYSAGGAGDPSGGWPFTVEFDLTGLDPTTALITGRWLADNQGVNIAINGVMTGQGTGANAWQTWSDFTIDGNFQAGVNALTFYVDNIPGAVGNPVGARVEFLSATADALPSEVPEPATFVLLGAGLVGLGLLRRTKKTV